MDQATSPVEHPTPSTQQAQREFLTQPNPEGCSTPSPSHSAMPTAEGYYQPLTTYLGDLVSFLGSCDQQEQQQMQTNQRLPETSSMQTTSTIHNSSHTHVPQLDLDTIIKKQHAKNVQHAKNASNTETGTLSDVLQQIQKEQQTENHGISSQLSVDKSFSVAKHLGGGYQPVVSAEFQELGIQEYDYTMEYSDQGDREAHEGCSGQQQQLKLLYLNQYKPQEHQDRGNAHGSAWQHELQGGEGGQGDGQLDNYGLYDNYTGPNTDSQVYFHEDPESIKSQFYTESQNMKDLLYNTRKQLSGEPWKKVGEVVLAIDSLCFSFSNIAHALAQEQLRTNQLHDQLALVCQHVQRLKQELMDLWNRTKVKEDSQREETNVLKEELQAKSRECEQLAQLQERLQKENLTLKRELVRQVESQNSGYVSIVSERNILKDRVAQLIQEIKIQKSHNRDLERFLSFKGMSFPLNNVRYSGYDQASNASTLDILRQRAQLFKAQQQQQQQQLQQQQQQQHFLQRHTPLNSQTSATATPPSEQASQDPPAHIQAPEPPEALDSPSDFLGGSMINIENGRIEDEYYESEGSYEQEDEDGRSGGRTSFHHSRQGVIS